ncbi:MAG: hypothetical protein Q8L84_13910 [Hyphomonas sp.]|nr:hypothetical protein [Hyphomonas sp.]
MRHRCLHKRCIYQNGQGTLQDRNVVLPGFRAARPHSGNGSSVTGKPCPDDAAGENHPAPERRRIRSGGRIEAAPGPDGISVTV